MSTGRLIGGPNACRVKAHSKPWIARLAFKNYPHDIRGGWCGGTIISESLVLTAAHCSNVPRFEEQMVVMIGEHDIETKDENQMIEIDHVIRHPKSKGIQNTRL